MQKPKGASRLVGGTPPGHVVQEGFLSACGHVSFSHFAIRILNARWAVLPQHGSDTAPHVMAGGAHCKKEREVAARGDLSRRIFLVPDSSDLLIV